MESVYVLISYLTINLIKSKDGGSCSKSTTFFVHALMLVLVYFLFPKDSYYLYLQLVSSFVFVFFIYTFHM